MQVIRGAGAGALRRGRADRHDPAHRARPRRTASRWPTHPPARWAPRAPARPAARNWAGSISSPAPGANVPTAGFRRMRWIAARRTITCGSTAARPACAGQMDLGGGATASARLEYYDEARGAGLVGADSEAKGLMASMTVAKPASGGQIGWRVQGWAIDSMFDNTSVSVMPDRSSTTPSQRPVFRAVHGLWIQRGAARQFRGLPLGGRWRRAARRGAVGGIVLLQHGACRLHDEPPLRRHGNHRRALWRRRVRYGAAGSARSARGRITGPPRKAIWW